MKKLSPKQKMVQGGLLMAAGEDLMNNISVSSLCTECPKDYPEYGQDMEKMDTRAFYIFKGKGLCKRHFEKYLNKQWYEFWKL